MKERESGATPTAAPDISTGNSGLSCAINVPEELKCLNHWVMWNKDKTPVDLSGIPTDAGTLNLSYKAAVEALAAHPGRFSGIGFAFTENDPFVGVDYDHVLNSEGVLIDPVILAEVQELNSYTEVSQSGSGLHVICQVDNWPDGIPRGTKRATGELYYSGRYFALTGSLWKNCSSEIRTVDPELIRQIHRRLNPIRPTPRRTPSRAHSAPQTDLSDDWVVDLLRNSNRTGILYRGSIAGFDSISEATLSLLNHICFYTKDAGQIDRIFRRSGLMRPKFDDARGNSTWGAQQIEKALADTTGSYDPFHHSREEITRGRAIADRLFRRSRNCQN